MILYAKDSCAPCKTVKYFLDKMGVDYEVRNVADEANYQELAKYANSVPVLVQGEQFVIGANLQAIRSLVGNPS